MATETMVWNSTTLWTNDGSDARVIPQEEQDLSGRVHTFEELGDGYASILRGSRRKQSPYTIVCLLKVDGTYTTVQALKAWWRGLHSESLGAKVLQRNTLAGNTRYLDAVADEPKFSDEQLGSVRVTQAYTPTRYYWRSAEQSQTGTFNGSTPVNVSCSNGGDVPTPLRWHAVGVLSDPKVALDDWEQEFDVDLASGDVFDVDSKTPATVYKTPSGGDATRWYGYRTEATMFRTALLAVGNNSVAISCLSGTTTFTAYWYNLYEALA